MKIPCEIKLSTYAKKFVIRFLSQQMKHKGDNESLVLCIEPIV